MAEAEIPHTWLENPEQKRIEARAVVGILGALAGLDTLPSVNPDAGPVPLMPIDESVNVLGGAKHLPGPVRLELVARLAHAQRQEWTPILGVDFDVGALTGTLMESGVVPEPGLADTLSQAIAQWTPGVDPFKRTTLADFDQFRSVNANTGLRHDIVCNALVVTPGCGAVTTSVKGIQALSIVTDLYTCKEFDEFETLIDPHEWPKCWLESLFFRSMVDGPGSVKQAAPDPDEPHGWQRTLVETVDFALGMSGDDSQCLETELNVTYFWNGPAAAGSAGAAGPGLKGGTPAVSFSPGVPAPGALATAAAPPVVTRSPVAAAGCTYDLKSSVNNRILVDQGFLLVEEIPDRDVRRYRTQKEICFASGNLPPGMVCSFWSLASGLIMQGC